MEEKKKEKIEVKEKSPFRSLKQTADWLDMHPNTLRNMTKMGIIDAYRIGKKYVYDFEDVKASLKKNCKTNLVEIGLKYRGITSTNGYLQVYIGKHPMADKNGYVLLHRLIMQGLLGRTLAKEEIVHAKNGDPLDLRISNLEIIESLGEHNARKKSLKEK